MMRFFKNKIVALVITIAVVTGALGVISKTGNNFLTNALNTLSTPVQGLFSKVLRPFNEHLTLLDEMKGYKSENERLIKQITELKKENRDIQSYIAENNRLKGLLDLKQKDLKMETVAASVIARDYEKWYKGITINKGSINGIKKGDPVITADGILGLVESVGLNWSKVTTIFDSESAIGARFTRTGDVGVVEGDIELSELGKCKIEYISGTASIINGDILVTSGLGDVYPPELMIGKVSDVQLDAMGKIEYAVVEPIVDFEKIYEVLVVTDFEQIIPEVIPEKTLETVIDTEGTEDDEEIY